MKFEKYKIADGQDKDPALLLQNELLQEKFFLFFTQ